MVRSTTATAAPEPLEAEPQAVAATTTPEELLPAPGLGGGTGEEAAEGAGPEKRDVPPPAPLAAAPADEGAGVDEADFEDLLQRTHMSEGIPAMAPEEVGVMPSARAGHAGARETHQVMQKQNARRASPSSLQAEGASEGHVRPPAGLGTSAVYIATISPVCTDTPNSHTSQKTAIVADNGPIP
jgi:hypothetical protein